MSDTSTSRTTRSARNAGASIVAQVVIVILGFVTRTVFISVLGVALLGVNSLLTSFLALLAIADLGINGAFMFALYEPLSKGDLKKTTAIVNYAGFIYRWIALIVGVVGVAVVPFLQQLVRLDERVDYLELYYLILLANTVASYLMQNRLILLNADQKIYLTKIYTVIMNVLRAAAQIVSLLIFEDFAVFLAIQVFFTIATNLLIYIKVGKLYPNLKKYSDPIERAERRSILNSTRALMVYRVGGLALNNSIPILISVLIGTVTLGYYSNYMLIIGSVVMVVEVVFSALTPSVGNLISQSEAHKGTARLVLNEIVLLSILIHGFLAVGFIAVIDDFVVVWLGDAFVLPIGVVIALVLNFYVTGMTMPLWSYRSATGLFRRTKYVIIITAVISIPLSFLLESVLGLTGIVIAPVIARLVTSAWYEPWILIRDYLHGTVISYFAIQVGAFVLWGLLALLMLWASSIISADPIISLGVKIVLSALLSSIFGWLAFRKLEAFQSLILRFRKIVRLALSGLQKG